MEYILRLQHVHIVFFLHLQFLAGRYRVLGVGFGFFFLTSYYSVSQNSGKQVSTGVEAT